MQFLIKKWSKIPIKTTNSQKCAFFDCANFWQDRKSFRSFWRRFSRDGMNRELRGGMRIEAGILRRHIGANNYSPPQ